MKTAQTNHSLSTILLLILSAGLLLSLFSFFSCSKDEEATPPVISGFELGYQNSHSAYAGSDLHLEAAILAEGKIRNIILEIHPEGSHKGIQLPALSGNPWEIDTTYTGKYSGVKNATFHEHLDIPATADTGHYHVHFIVTDMAGNQTSREEDLRILLPSDTIIPVVQ